MSEEVNDQKQPQKEAENKQNGGGKRKVGLVLLVLILIAALAGGVGQAIGGFSRGGCLIAIVMGFIGALVGTWIARQFALPGVLMIQIQGEDFPVFWAIVGAAVE